MHSILVIRKVEKQQIPWRLSLDSHAQVQDGDSVIDYDYITKTDDETLLICKAQIQVLIIDEAMDDKMTMGSVVAQLSYTLKQQSDQIRKQTRLESYNAKDKKLYFDCVLIL